MYDIMGDDVKNYLDNKGLNKQDEKIDKEDKLDISIYLRY
jgi:hypothetical protein